MGIQKYLVAMLLFTGCLFTSSYSFAVCSNNEDGQPGQNGEIEYFTVTNQLMYCDNTNWVEMSDPSAPPTSCDNIGDTCPDGSVYAGISPDGDVKMYTTPSDAGSTYQWNDGTTNWVDTSMTNCGASAPAGTGSCDTGQNNTDILVALSGGGSPAPYQAAEYCDDLSVHTYDDWYLPSQNELYVLYSNQGTIGGFSSTDYWSSSESGNNTSHSIDFNNGNTSNSDKDESYQVRCVRRGPLIAYWTLDETSGSTITDSAGGNTGVWDDDGDDDVSGETVAGQVGNALTFGNAEINAGSDDTVDNLYSKGGMSVCAWIYPDSVPGAVAPIIVKNGTNFGDYGWSVYLNKAGGQTIEFYTNLDSYIAPNIGYALDTWQHICFTWDGSEGTSGLTSYVNGVEPSGTTYLGDDSATVFDDSTYDIRIGYDDSGSTIFDGVIDDVRIYNRVISAADVADIYNGTNGSDLIGHWKLDETSGTTAADSSGNGLNGSMLGTLNAGSDNTSGVIGTALNFEGQGSDDEISIQDTSLDVEEFSFAVWVRSTRADCSVSDFNCPGIVRKVTGNPPSASSDVGWYLVQRSGQARASFHDGDGTVVRLSNATIINDGRWHHIAVTRDSGKNNIVYVDGVAGTPGSDTYNVASTAPLQIGSKLSNASGGAAWDGDMDDARYYNRALSASEIEVLANCTGPGSYYYNFTVDAMQWCDDAATIFNMGPPASGSGGCTGSSEGALRYNTDRYQFCDGSGWVDIGK